MGRPRALIASNDAALRSLIAWVHARLDETDTTYEQVATEVSYSRSWVSRALCGRRLPTWKLVETIASSCDASPREARKLWEAASAAHLRRQVRRIGIAHPSEIASWLEMYDALGDLISSKVGSQRELVRKDESGQLTRSTIGAILRHERSLSHSVLIRVLTVCELSDKEREAWMDAWERYGRPRRELMEDLRRAIAYSRLHPEASASLPRNPE
jgi:transcriptional regulator with XRE-family HTH domain